MVNSISFFIKTYICITKLNTKMIDYNLYDKELNNWIDNEKIAANLLNLTGQLMYDKGIEIVLFRQNILDVGVTELMRLVAYAENVVERKIDLKTALALTQVISDLELPPSKLDLGLLTAEYLEEKPENHKREELAVGKSQKRSTKANLLQFFFFESPKMMTHSHPPVPVSARFQQKSRLNFVIFE